MVRTTWSTVGLLIVLFMGATLLSCGSPRTEEAAAITPPVLPGVTSWLKAHSAYGTAVSTQTMPDWAGGKRQQVRTTAGAYLFYLEGEEVITVYRNDAAGRQEVWRKPGK